ncbi:MAG: helix-turn-helix transcriptional regulator [Verrucomicrobiota bacterium]
MRGPELWKAAHALVLSMHRAESFPNAIELALLGLQTILDANNVQLYCHRYHRETEKLGKLIKNPSGKEDTHGVIVERSVWPREDLCLRFCAQYTEAPDEDELLIFEMTLEQLICASEHLPSEPDHDIDRSLLSRREREVLPLIAAAKTNGQIAEHLGISERTVEKHVASILDKTGLENRKMIIAASQGRRIATLNTGVGT